jgi:hypothetical protein
MPLPSNVLLTVFAPTRLVLVMRNVSGFACFAFSIHKFPDDTDFAGRVDRVPSAIVVNNDTLAKGRRRVAARAPPSVTCVLPRRQQHTASNFEVAILQLADHQAGDRSESGEALAFHRARGNQVSNLHRHVASRVQRSRRAIPSRRREHA